ncbi:MAG: spore germination protein [Candidatus Coproplasma sp.]
MSYGIKERIEEIKKTLTSPDVLAFEFVSLSGKKFAVMYLDGIADKNLLGELVVKPLREVEMHANAEEVKSLLASPEVNDGKDFNDAVSQILEGNAVLFIDGEEEFFTIGLKNPPGRAVAEPPTQITVKGPREGFTEDIKTNLGLVRKRIKSEKLQVKMLSTGKQSATAVALVYLDGICDKNLPEKIEKQIADHEIDIIPDSSYIAGFVSKRPRSLFKRCATSEKPDIFCAKICEGRIGIIVDGSPIALTAPYMICEDFQAAEDYYITSYRASVIRAIRVIAVIVGVLLPAFYICAQLFKIQLIPLKLLFKIASSVSGIPLSPSVEMFFTLFVLEVLNEASIRMPKYVGLALSVVGALVLGDTAVKAGIISTPAVIIVAFSAICLYTVPDLVETTTTLRLLFLIVAGSLGTYAMVLLIAFLICYLASEQSYGTPLLSPFAPLTPKDLSDSLIKTNMYSLGVRPRVFRTKNKVRLKIKND